MPYTVAIIHNDNATATGLEVFRQTVDRLDISLVFQAVNTPPPEPKKRRSDFGKPKAKKESQP